MGNMERIFIEVLNMSLTGCVVISAVLLARLLLRRSPRIFSYALWVVVLFRLLCPVSFSLEVSVLKVLRDGASEDGRMAYIPQEIAYQEEPDAALPGGTMPGVPEDPMPTGNAEEPVHPVQILLFAGARLWLFGIAGMLGHSIYALVRLNKRLGSAVRESGNVYRLPGMGTPFVYGLFRPRIYCPERVEGAEREYILLHEQLHIRRGDHITRLLAYLALCIHWFNPLVWTAFSLSGKDMEMSCDEAVLRRMGSGVKRAYSESLLALAAGGNRYEGNVPPAFGERDTGGRIKNVLRYRSPGMAAVGIAAALCLAAAVCLLANPEPAPVAENDSGTEDGGESPAGTEEDGVTAAVQQEGMAIETEGETESVAAVQMAGRPPLTPGDIVDGRVADGSYYLYVRDIARSARTIDRYQLEEESVIETSWEKPELAFSADCTFYVNVRMDGVRYEERDFDAFVSLAEDAFSYMAPQVEITFQDGLIKEAYLNSAYYGGGIEYVPVRPVRWGPDLEAVTGKPFDEVLEEFYVLTNTLEADISDAEGVEIIEVYTGNIGDGESGLVLCRDENGQLLYMDGAHHARAGWNNIYLGERDGQPFLMTMHIEDRDDYGSYQYGVFRLDAAGGVRQIAGSEFTFGGDVGYRDGWFREWADALEGYLADSVLLLSSQEGEIRTDGVSEADRYNYETLQKDWQ